MRKPTSSRGNIKSKDWKWGKQDLCVEHRNKAPTSCAGGLVVSRAAFHIIWLLMRIGVWAGGSCGKGVGMTRLWENSLNVMLES